MRDIAARLRSTLASEGERLAQLTDETASRRPAPGKWSPKEIIGHLVDSASNNHGRFVRALLEDHLNFPGYEQDEWVRAQHYNERPWPELLGLWNAMNTSLASLIEVMPPETLSRQRSTHNLDRIAWRTVPADQPVTLEYFVRDYVDHLEHHLSQTR